MMYLLDFGKQTEDSTDVVLETRASQKKGAV